MFDADEAGVAASLRGFERSVPGDLDLRVAVLPIGRDPAELVDAGETETVNKAIEESVPLLQFRIERELDRFDLSEPEARGRAVRATSELVARHPDPVTRHEYAVFVARRTGIEMNVVAGAVEQAARAGEPPPARPRRSARISGAEKAEREWLRLLLANHPGVREAGIGPEVFGRAEHAEAFEMLAPVVAALDPGEPPDLGSLLGTDESDMGRMLTELAFEERPLADPTELAKRLKVGALDDRIQHLRNQIAVIDADQEPETYSDLFRELIALEQERRTLRGNE